MKDLFTTEALRRAGRAYALKVGRGRIRVTEGEDAGKEAVIASESLVVGAHPDCGLVLTDQTVSRHHLEILRSPHGWLVRDLDATNGTFAGGTRIREAFLSIGTKLQAGNTFLVFEADRQVSEPLHSESRFHSLLGESPIMRHLFQRLQKVAGHDVTVLLEGETGTGKELAADSIHKASDRAGGPFVVVDCASVPRTLIESELFGHERGAFTGATNTRAGAFELADGGTLFLDEIGELELDFQPRLLRALEQREVKRVGGADVRKVNVRVVAATNRDLLRMVSRGAFREDLYYRLSAVRMRLPALRERLSDIPKLVGHFCEMLSGQDTHPAVSDSLLEQLSERDWPGNVRELRNVLENVIVFGDPGEQPTPPATTDGQGAVDPENAIDRPFKIAKAEWVEQFERSYLGALMEQVAENISQAARTAAIDRVHLVRLLDKYGLRKRRGN